MKELDEKLEWICYGHTEEERNQYKNDGTEHLEIDMDALHNYGVEEDILEYIKGISKTKVYSESTIKSLISKTKHGDNNAKQRLVESYLKLVVVIAIKKWNYIDRVPFEDFMQAGNLGVVQAIDYYITSDLPKKLNLDLTTFVKMMIVSFIGDTLKNQDKMIVLSGDTRYVIRKAIIFARAFLAEYNHEPSYEDIAKGLRISKDKIPSIVELAYDTISLESLVRNPDTDDIDNEIINFSEIVPTNGDIVLDEVLSNDLKEQIDKLTYYKDLFSDRQRKVLRLMFGLDGGKAFDVRMLAAEFDISEARVRQIQARIYRKLRVYGRIRLRDFEYTN